MPPEYCLLWINWWPLCMTKAEWSGWVQAIGSIAAILAGFFFINHQHVLQQRAVLAGERRRRSELALSLASRIEQLRRSFEAASAEWLRGGDVTNEDRVRMSNQLTVLVKAPFPELLPASMQHQFLTAQVVAQAAWMKYDQDVLDASMHKPVALEIRGGVFRRAAQILSEVETIYTNYTRLESDVTL
ncbi:MAG TPA: hypothetical protein VFR90_01440 [Methylibium sp.]|uniref:hypothetical protein n=1 Tax=Methylibium sp. TaxID=2067992 RepID=UPI002DB7DABC|nr:hypothetical protein [Methylibium sp.]HEU4457769.1 hypothetical protein [Methylibium sp.]